MPTQTLRWASAATLAALDEYPCLRCLSEQDIYKLLARALCLILSTDRTNECTTAEQVEAAHCYSCFSDKELLQIVAARILTYAATQGYITNLDAMIQDIVCLGCVPDKASRGMIVDQIESGINNGTLFNPS